MQEKKLHNVIIIFMKINKKKEINGILDRIKERYGLTTDIELSSFLDITQPRLSNWRSRGTIDIFIIINKCRDIDLHWLLTGERRKEGGGADIESEKLKEAYKRIKKLELKIEILKELLAEERNKCDERKDKERGLKRSNINTTKISERK